MGTYNGLVKIDITPVSKKLEVSQATTTDTCPVYSNEGINGSLPVTQLYQDMVTLYEQGKEQLGLLGINTYNPTGNGTEPVIKYKERNRDGKKVQEVYLGVFEPGRRASTGTKQEGINVADILAKLKK